MFQFDEIPSHFFLLLFTQRTRNLLCASVSSYSEAIVDKPRPHFPIHPCAHLFACSEIAKWGGKSAPLSQKRGKARWDSS